MISRASTEAPSPPWQAERAGQKARQRVAVIRSVIRGCGAYLPARRVTNAELAETIDTSDAWIKERTGISARHIAAEGELTSDLGTHAAKQALVRAAVSSSVQPRNAASVVAMRGNCDGSLRDAARVARSSAFT